jgi:hypothetical protein
MPDVTAPAADAPRKNLVARAIGVVVSPRDTYADIAAAPRVLLAFCVVLAVLVGAQTLFTTSQLGRELMLDQSVRMVEAFGMQVNDQVYEALQRQASQPWYRAAIGGVVFLAQAAAAIAGLIMAIFNAVLGGEARYKQVLAIVVYSGFLLAAQTFFIYPMFYLKESMASPTSLAVFLPMLDDTSFLGRLVGGFDLFRLWWTVNLAIGVGVLYKRKTSPIVTSMLIVYAFIVLVVAAIGSALGA